jgi:putative endonuclease
MAGHLYLLASRRHGTLYIGVTTDLPKRIYEHREGLVPGFTRRYGVKRLVYVETYDDVSDAIVRERRMKEWKRERSAASKRITRSGKTSPSPCSASTP